MKKKIKLTILFTLLGLMLAIIIYLAGTNIAILNPKGWVALKQRDLLVISTLLMLIVVLPVYYLTFFIIWKYRASNKQAKYRPDWDYNLLAEATWWGLPFVIVAILSVMTYYSCHQLDPFKPLVSNTKPLRVQVVALQWKWLFIYPEQNIASVNLVQFPEQTPISFEITSDAPMNSFWIPQLGGQIYAMPGMRSKLHLIADEPGSYYGASANLSGKGFSGMTFTAKSCSEADFNLWVEKIKLSPLHLSLDEYNKLAEPSEYNREAFYLLTQEGLFDQIVSKYMMPSK